MGNSIIGTNVRGYINGLKIEKEVGFVLEYGQFNLAILHAIFDETQFNELKPLVSKIIDLKLMDTLNNNILYEGEASILKQKFVANVDEPCKMILLIELIN
jgi:hypothetical protein